MLAQHISEGRAGVAERRARLKSGVSRALGASGMGAKKPPVKAGAKSRTKKSARATNRASGPEVAPYLQAQDIASVGDRLESGENARAGITNNFERMAAEAYRGSQEADRQRTEGTAAVNNNAAARGLGRSSIRDAGLDKVDAATARAKTGMRDQLAMQFVQDQGALRTLGRGDDNFMVSLAARAAENAAAVPRAPQQVQAQRAARNVKGAKTRRRAK